MISDILLDSDVSGGMIELAYIVCYDESMKGHLKDAAIKLRKRGFSYNLIAEKLKIGKSTLSCWLKEIPFKPNKEVLKRIKTGPQKSGMVRHNQRVEKTRSIKKIAKKEIGIISLRDLWMLGLGLYIGEGAKSIESLRIINSDPEIIKVAIKWFKEVLNLKNENIVISVHIYPDNNLKKCLNFWSNKTKLPTSQFKKTQVDKRVDKMVQKIGKLPFGTAHIRIVSNGNPDFGVDLHRKVMGWIEASIEQINTRV